MTLPYTMTTPYWSDFVPNSTFNQNLSGFHRTSTTGVACRQGTLTPPDTWSRPFGTCICSTCWDQSFSELVVILPDYALRITLGTFSIFLSILGTYGVTKNNPSGNFLTIYWIQTQYILLLGEQALTIFLCKKSELSIRLMSGQPMS